jgi:hypothetical protein
MPKSHEDELAAEFERLDAILDPHIERFRLARDRSAERFAGLFIPDSDIEGLLSGNDAATESAVAPPPQPRESPLAHLARLFRLSTLERDILLLAGAPEFEPRYQTLYAWLQNDATRKHPTVGFALRMLCPNRDERWQSFRFFEENRDLVSNRLIRFVDDPQDRDPSMPWRMFRLYPRIAGILGGQKGADPAMASARVITPRTAFRDLELPAAMRLKLEHVAEAIRNGGLLHLHGQTDFGHRGVAEAVCGHLAKKLMLYEPLNFEDADHGAILRRECRLMNAGLYIAGPGAPIARQLSNAPFPIVTAPGPERAAVPRAEDSHAEYTAPEPEPVWTTERSFRIDLEMPDVSSRMALWRRRLNGAVRDPALAGNLPALAGKFCFDPGQIQSVVDAAHNAAILRDGGESGISVEDLHEAARVHSVSGLRHLARRVSTRFTWDDLIVPTRIRRQLCEIVDSVRLRHTVEAEWQFDRKTGANSGVTVMFSGVSGTGKTMSASILARELNLDLYKIDLAGVVSKYIGETEKNLNRIFDAARNSSSILFFDEADALFGKRAEVKEAHDRYANIEVAYLLQKMEEFSGLVILATNLSRNIDAAFQRRLRHVIEFPFPDAQHREKIWRGMFPEAAPRGNGIDFSFLARQFEFSGGNIRNVVVAAAYLAAADSRPVSMEHLIQATGREFQKMGKLPSRGEFREHFDSIRDRV